MRRYSSFRPDAARDRLLHGTAARAAWPAPATAVRQCMSASSRNCRLVRRFPSVEFPIPDSLEGNRPTNSRNSAARARARGAVSSSRCRQVLHAHMVDAMVVVRTSTAAYDRSSKTWPMAALAHAPRLGFAAAATTNNERARTHTSYNQASKTTGTAQSSSHTRSAPACLSASTAAALPTTLRAGARRALQRRPAWSCTTT